MASSKAGPFQEFYAGLVAKGMKPEMARLTLARKVVTIVLFVWKKGVCFDAQHLKPQQLECLLARTGGRRITSGWPTIH